MKPAATFIAVGVLASLSTACASAAPIHPVRADPYSGAVRGAVPFDVPLLVYGVAPEGTETLHLEISGTPTFLQAWSPGSGVATPDTFYFRFEPGLRARSLYTLQFTVRRKLSDPERAAFDRLASAELHKILDRPDLQGSWDDATQIEVCEGLQSAFRAAARGDQQVELSGPLAEGECEKLQTEFGLLVDDVVEGPGARNQATGSFRQHTRSLAGMLHALENDPTFSTIASILSDAVRTRMLEAQQLVAGYDDAVSLIQKIEAGEGAQISLAGHVPSVDSERIGPAARVQALRDTIEARSAAILGIAALLRAFPGSEFYKRLQRTAVIGPELVDSLPPLIGRLEELESVSAEQQSSLFNYSTALGRQEQALARLLATAIVRSEATSIIWASPAGDFETRAGNYFALDGGVLVAPTLGEAAPYIAANAYFVPVNRDAPLGFVLGDYSKRISVNFGVTLEGITSEDDPFRHNLFGSSAGVAGFGYRLTDNIRTSLGLLLFRRSETDGSTGKEITASEYAALSLDIDVVELLNGLGGVFGSILPD